MAYVSKHRPAFCEPVRSYQDARGTRHEFAIKSSRTEEVYTFACDDDGGRPTCTCPAANPLYQSRHGGCYLTTHPREVLVAAFRRQIPLLSVETLAALEAEIGPKVDPSNPLQVEVYEAVTTALAERTPVAAA